MRRQRRIARLVVTVLLGVGAILIPLLTAGADRFDGRLEELVFVANRESNDVTIIDARTDRIIRHIPVGARPHMTVLSAAGKVYTTGTGSNDVTIIDARTLKVEGRLPVQATGPEHGTVSPDGRWLYIANVEGNAVSVVDLVKGQTVGVLKGLSQPHNIVFSKDGSKAYIAQVGSYKLAVYRVDSQKLTAEVTVGSQAKIAALKPQEIHGVNNAVLAHGMLFATNQDAGEVAVIDVTTDKMVEVIKVGREPWEPYETPDGTKILVPNLGDETVSVIDTKTRRVVATLPGGKDMTGVVVTADSRKAYVTRRGDDKVSVLDLDRLTLLKEIAVGKTPEVPTRTVGGKVYVTNSGSGDVTVIDTKTDQVVTTIQSVGRYPWAAASFGGYNYCH